ncbi:MAG: hypothetical protein AB7K24_31660 [Gemmataceae bacterium]
MTCTWSLKQLWRLMGWWARLAWRHPPPPRPFPIHEPLWIRCELECLRRQGLMAERPADGIDEFLRGRWM